MLLALKRMLAMRHFKRAETVDGVNDTRALEEVGLTEAQAQEMYRYLAIANYEDRFVVPSSHRELAREAFPEKKWVWLYLWRRLPRVRQQIQPVQQPPHRRDGCDQQNGAAPMIELVIVSRLLEYPDAALVQHQQELFDALASSENLDKEDAQTLGIFLRDLLARDLLDAQADYSQLFDRGRATSLLLFEHVHGESATVVRRWWI